MAQVEGQGGRHDAGVGDCVDGDSRGALDRLLRQPGEEGGERRLLGADGGLQHGAAMRPGGHEEVEDDGDDDGQPGAVEELERASGHEQGVEHGNAAHEQQHGEEQHGPAVFEAPAGGHNGGQEARDEHRRSDRHAVGVGQVRRRAKGRRDHHHHYPHCHGHAAEAQVKRHNA